MIEIFDKKFYSGYIIKENKILAYSINLNQNKLIEQLKNIAKYHNLNGDLIFDEKLDHFFENRIKRFINGEKFSFDLNYYKNKEVYEELLKTNKGEIIKYKELYNKIKEKININFFEMIRTLKNNPFIILIPCHRVIKTDGIGGYTPLGVDFKIKLLKTEGYL